MIYDFKLRAERDERCCAIEHMDYMGAGDILVLDRGCFGYILLQNSIKKNIFIICRLQMGCVNQKIKDFYEIKENDKIIEYKPNHSLKFYLKKRGFQSNFESIPIRLIKYQIDGKTYICATTLMSSDYLIEDMAKLYHGRWGIEELYKISKQHIDVEDFHSRAERGVKQELYAHLVLINIARIFEAETNKKLPPSEKIDNSSDING